MTGFGVEAQNDFRAGMFQFPSPELIPANGAYDVVNGLFDQDEGTIYRRGGTTNILTATATTSPHSLWDGYLATGHATILVGNSYVGVLKSDLTAWITRSTVPVDAPYSPVVEVGGMAVFPMDTSSGYGVYAGSLTGPSYTTGGITTTTGSTTVAGSGTSFVGNVDPGMILVASGGQQWGIVKSVTDGTHLELYDPWTTAGTSGAYEISPIYNAPTPSSLHASPNYPMYATTVGSAGRLVLGAGNRVAFSNAGNIARFGATDYHQLPEGVLITGLTSLRDTVFAFTTNGVWAISNMNFELTDAYGNPQQRLDQISKTTRLWSPFGIAGWEDKLVVPCSDDVYLMGTGGFERAMSEPIRTLYRSYVTAGKRLGRAAVSRDHYFLPVVTKVYSGRSIIAGSFSVVDVLVCHLPSGAWSRLADLAGSVAVFAAQPGTETTAPKLLGYTKHLTGVTESLLDLSSCFAPSSSVKSESDGTTHGFSVTTRDYATGSNKSNLVKKARLRFEGTASVGSPTLTASVASGPVSAAFTTVSTTDGSTVGPSTGTQTVPYSVNRADRFVRFKIATTDAWDTLKIKGLELFIRSRGRQ